jgi:hypothetical protein
MIKANDLRIGNFIVDPEFPLIPSTVNEIQNDGFIVTNYNDHLTNKKAEPLILTDEILEKCGFNNIDRTNIFLKVMHEVNGTKLKSLAVYLDEDIYTVAIAIVDYYTGVEKTDFLHLDYKYLHQLQNLYYSLVGSELEVVW